MRARTKLFAPSQPITQEAFVHPTSPPGDGSLALGMPLPMLEFIFETARTASNLVFSGALARYSDIEWVFTHGGGALPLLADRMEVFRTVMGGGPGPSVQQQIARLWFDMAGTPFPNQVPSLVRAFGPERLLYGSDYCWTPAAATASQADSLTKADQPPATSWRTLTSANARGLFAGSRPQSR
jgi:predicted TIM-barrel fold metal-dependent hydrolase